MFNLAHLRNFRLWVQSLVTLVTVSFFMVASKIAIMQKLWRTIIPKTYDVGWLKLQCWNSSLSYLGAKLLKNTDWQMLPALPLMSHSLAICVFCRMPKSCMLSRMVWFTPRDGMCMMTRRDCLMRSQDNANFCEKTESMSMNLSFLNSLHAK